MAIFPINNFCDTLYKIFSTQETLQTVTNHPVHILDRNGKLSPSSFIPYCEFGGNMSAMGVHIKESYLPICNRFTAEILNDQLCYTVDLNTYKDEEDFQDQLKLGLVFLMDYNEDRQVPLNESQDSINIANLVNNIDESNDDKNALIYLNTIGQF